MKVLAIGAHFNNVEIGCGGTLARYVAEGHEVTIYTAATKGVLTADRVEADKSGLAFQNAQESAKLIGAKLICGGFETLHLEFNDDLNAKLTHLLNKEKPDLIFTHFPGDPQHDHISLTRGILHAGRAINKILTYRSTWYQSGDPFMPNVYMNISNYWEKKEAAMRIYQTNSGIVTEEKIAFFKNDARNNGIRNGVKYAEGFQIIKWLD